MTEPTLTDGPEHLEADPPTVRQRRRRPDGSIACEDLHSDDDQPVEIARLRTVLNLLAEGRSQSEIAEHFNRSTRTIRRWIADAKRHRIQTMKDMTPEDLVSATLFRYFQIAADLQAMKREALEEGDRRSAIECLRQIRQTERDKYLVLEKVGLFENFSFLQPREDPAPGEREKHRLDEMLETILEGREFDFEAQDNRNEEESTERLF